MKFYQVQESHHTKEETTWEHEDDFQEDQPCEDLEQPYKMFSNKLFCPTIDPNGKSQDYLIFSILWS